MKSKNFKYLDVIIDNPNSWMWSYILILENILNNFSQNIRIFRDANEIMKGDILFILSCDKILNEKDLNKHNNNIVIHASDLPKGKGWSPWSWEVESGVKELTLTLFEAELVLDSGHWYIKDKITLDGGELIDDLRNLIALKEFDMIENYLLNYSMKANKQKGNETFRKKRTSKNQELDIEQSIKEQFNKLRICDNENFPAHFYIDMGGVKNKNTFLKFTKQNNRFIYMKYLEWDTIFFNKKSFTIDMNKSNFIPNKGILVSVTNNFENTFITLKLNTSYDKIYSNFFQQCGFQYIDTEVILLLKNATSFNSNKEVKIEKLDKNLNLPYYELGSSFSLSRFHSDLNISNKKADKLWIEYLKNFIPTNNKFLYVAKLKDDIIGVVLVNINKEIANLFYIAVLDNYRGHGVGHMLIRRIKKDLKEFDIMVGTQIKNIKALNFYIKNGFVITNTNSVFHRFNN